MAPTLEQIFTMRLNRPSPSDTSAATLSLGPTHGSAPRVIAPLTGGHLLSLSLSSTSPLSAPINATFVPGGSDWLRVDPSTSTGHLDCRIQFRDSSRDANFYVRFEGLVRMNDEIGKIVNWDRDARSLKSSECYHFMAPVIEVSREEDRWMEQTAWVGHGHYVVEKNEEGEVKAQAVEYEIYRLVTG